MQLNMINFKKPRKNMINVFKKPKNLNLELYSDEDQDEMSTLESGKVKVISEPGESFAERVKLNN